MKRRESKKPLLLTEYHRVKQEVSRLSQERRNEKRIWEVEQDDYHRVKQGTKIRDPLLETKAMFLSREAKNWSNADQVVKSPRVIK